MAGGDIVSRDGPIATFLIYDSRYADATGAIPGIRGNGGALLSLWFRLIRYGYDGISPINGEDIDSHPTRYGFRTWAGEMLICFKAVVFLLAAKHFPDR